MIDGVIINEADLTLRAFTANLVLAASEALEESAPLEVDESDQHDAETTHDRDVE